MATVLSKEGDSVFDLAARLYGDTALGLSDLLAKNDFNHDADVPAMTSVIYTENLSRQQPIIYVPILPNPDTDYLSKEGDSIYDIAARLHKDTALGISDLLAKNSFDLDTEVPAKTVVVYSQGLSRQRPIFFIPRQETPAPYRAIQYQNVFDLAVQLYGSVETGLPLLLNQISNLNAAIPAGTLIEYNAGSEFKVKVATDPAGEPSLGIGIGYMIIESTFIVG